MTVYEKKSKRKRTFPISEELHTNLKYLCDFKQDSDFLFESHHKHGVSVHRSTIHRKIKKALKWQNKSIPDASSHSARKLYAQNIYEETGSVEKVQQALHHRKISTTLAYLDKLQQKVAEIEKTATQYAAATNIFCKIRNFIKKLFRR
jgi:integrase